MLVFQSSAVWTKPAGITSVLGFLWGGGGGAAGASATKLAAGGGGAEFRGGPVTMPTAETAVQITIGAGGPGGNGGAGGPGGFSQFGADTDAWRIKAMGGGGSPYPGDSVTGGGAGGTGGIGGSLIIPGGYGEPNFLPVAPLLIIPGAGGSAFGAPISWWSSAGNMFGGGGAAAGAYNTPGAPGGPGAIIVVW